MHLCRQLGISWKENKWNLNTQKKADHFKWYNDTVILSGFVKPYIKHLCYSSAPSICDEHNFWHVSEPIKLVLYFLFLGDRLLEFRRHTVSSRSGNSFKYGSMALLLVLAKIPTQFCTMSLKALTHLKKILSTRSGVLLYVSYCFELITSSQCLGTLVWEHLKLMIKHVVKQHFDVARSN